MSEGVQETEDFIHDQLFGGAPRSPGEAAAEGGRIIETPAPPEDAPIVVEDEPPGRDTEPDTPAPELPAEPAAAPEEGDEEEDTPEDEAVAWAKRKYGDDLDPTVIARAAFEQERHITRISREAREANELASQWYEYAQQVEQQAQQQTSTAMPLSAQEEQWVEQSLMDPLGYARTAALNGKTQLYQGVINRVAEENAGLAASIGTQVQMELASYAQQEQAPQAVPLERALAESFNRLGLDLQRQGPSMAQKIGELGEYHPYVRAIMDGNDGERDLAVQAISDLSRPNPVQEQRRRAIAQENELRRDVSSVQTGGIAAPAQRPATSPFVAAMEEEWRDRGQWPEE